MPKENTHIFFAYDVLSSLADPALREHLSAHLPTFLLGSIIPDTFYYSPHEAISDTLHGKDGNTTNPLLPDMIGPKSLSRDLAFTCGYLTHCALDIVLHPCVYYLSGNYYDPDPLKRTQAVYRHRHIETCLDVYLSNPYRIHTVLDHTLIEGLRFEQLIARDFQIDISAIRQALKKQLLYNRLFASAAAFRLLRLLHRLRIVKNDAILGLFYGICRANPYPLDGAISFRDLVSGEEQTRTVYDLLQTAAAKAVDMIQHAWRYAQGEITAADLLRVIPGESLDTGRLHVPVSDIRFTKD